MGGQCGILLTLLLANLVGFGNASHFRGAIITYEKGSTYNGQINVGVNYRIAWRRSSSGNFCDNSKIISGSLNSEGTLSCLSNCNGDLGPMSYACTDFSEIEDWSSGRGHINGTVPVSALPLYEFGFSGCCWISTLVRGNSGDWELRVRANLTTRSDTGRVNSPPGSDITPIVRLQAGCNNTIRIPIYDAEGDTVRCRWAIGNECGDVCQAFPDAVLNEETCTITYLSRYPYENNTLYAVAIQIEDFVTYTPQSQPLSSIPLQFLVNIFHSDAGCQIGSKPVFNEETLTDKSCITVPYGTNFTSNITVIVRDNSSISEIQTISPIGLIKGRLQQSYWNRSVWFMPITFTPRSFNSADNLFCFTAITSLGLASEKRCINLLSEAMAPRFIEYSRSPWNTTDILNTVFSIQLDKSFTWPIEPAAIRIYENLTDLVEVINASDTTVVSHLGDRLEFNISRTLQPGRWYRFIFDKGVVRGTTYCKPQSPAYTWDVLVHLTKEVADNNEHWMQFEMKQSYVVEKYCGKKKKLLFTSNFFLFPQCFLKYKITTGLYRKGLNVAGLDTPVRLVNGSRPSEGRLEIYSNNGWTSVCDRMFDRNDAEVICNMLGYHNNHLYLPTIHDSYEYGQGVGSIHEYSYDCSSYENDLADCNPRWNSSYRYCYHSDDVGIDCGVPVQLVLFTNVTNNGMVQIFDKYHGYWTSVCRSSFNDTDAAVVCKTLGYSVGHVSSTNYSVYASGDHVRNLQCTGQETDVSQCSYSTYPRYCTGYTSVAGVECGTQIRLVDGNTPYSGRVEVLYKEEWGTVCDDSFDRRDAIVICKILGYYIGDSYVRAYQNAHFGRGTGNIIIDDLDCEGYETDVSNCDSSPWLTDNCNHDEDASVDCRYGNYYTSPPKSTAPTTAVRLVNGTDRYSGRVEIWHNGQWGTICDDNFDHNEVMVICRMLGMNFGSNFGQYYSDAYFGQGSGPILLDDLSCYGHENLIQNCGSQGWYSNNCQHSEDVGVDCRARTQGATSSVYRYTTYPYYTSRTAYPYWLTTSYRNRLEDAISVDCDENGWNVRVDMTIVRQIHPHAVAGDIYMGDNSCTGTNRGYEVVFRQGLRDCLTNEISMNNNLVYRNQLVYAERDRLHPFIIRHFNWTVDIECDVGRNETSSGHLHHDSSPQNGHHVSGSSHYSVNMTFFSDPNFHNELQGNPLHVQVGQDVYAKVFTTVSDWTIKMRVHTCFTKPRPNAGDHLNLYMIQNGCEVDSNTHIISQSTHETRFVFQDFQYSSNSEGIYVYCKATFCDTSDYSRSCTQTCNP